MQNLLGSAVRSQRVLHDNFCKIMVWSMITCVLTSSLHLCFCGNSWCLSMGWAWRSGMGEHFPFFPKPFVLYIWNLPGPWGLYKHLWSLKKSGTVEDWKEQIKKTEVQNKCFSKLEVKHKNIVNPWRLVLQQTCIPGLMCHSRNFWFWRLHLEKSNLQNLYWKHYSNLRL